MDDHGHTICQVQFTQETSSSAHLDVLKSSPGTVWGHLTLVKWKAPKRTTHKPTSVASAIKYIMVSLRNLYFFIQV